ncbi:MAG: hypothetical protein R2881_04505 [Eubacteriales bacterium]
MIATLPVWRAKAAPANLLQCPLRPQAVPYSSLTDFSVPELTRLLDTLPIDITFVGADDTVRYFRRAASAYSPAPRRSLGAT